MDTDSILRIGQEALLLVLLLSAPGAVAALLVGLLVSLFQAATQVQEQTLSVVPKIVAVYLVLIAFGVWILGQLVSFSMQLFESIGQVG